MNSLFLGILMLFFAQGVVARDNWGARGLALAFVIGLAAACIYSLPW